jgi:hypothetical protein
VLKLDAISTLIMQNISSDIAPASEPAGHECSSLSSDVFLAETFPFELPLYENAGAFHAGYYNAHSRILHAA